MVLFGAMVISSRTYTAISFNPTDVADNIKKYGGFIPRIQAGAADGGVPRQDPDALFSRGDLHRRHRPASVDLPGGSEHQGLPFGGTSILITVGVTLETMKQIESQLMMRHTTGFLK